jgi:hypothetical protein
MKITTLIAAVLLVCSARAFSGEMYGSVFDGAKPVGEKVKIDVNASGKAYTAETDKNGAYRLFVKEKGKCTFTVHYKDQALAADIFSYDKSLRYDWVIESKDGKLQLKRK